MSSICCCCGPLSFTFLISTSLTLLTRLYLPFFRLFFPATASRVLWPSQRSCAVPTTGPTHHYADWIITIAYIRRPFGLPAKDSVPARVRILVFILPFWSKKCYPNEFEILNLFILLKWVRFSLLNGANKYQIPPGLSLWLIIFS